MRTGSRILVALIILGAVFYKACTKGDNSPYNDNVPKTNELRTQHAPGTTPIMIGMWRISLFKKNQTIITGSFEQNEFTFGRDGIIIAYSPGSKMKGTWAVGANDNPNYMTIEFPAASYFSMMNGGWNITVSNNLEMKMEQLGGDPATKDRLDFSKIERKNPSPTTEQ